MSQDTDKETVVEFNPETGFVSEIPVDGSAPQQAAGTQDASLEQLREILVGAQARDFETKLHAMREEIDGSILHLTQENADRIDKLESHVNSELEKVFKKLDSGIDSAEKKIEQLTERMGKTQTDLQEELAPQVNAVIEKLETLRQEVDADTSRLRSELVDRASLAEALTEIGARMKGDT